KNVPSARPTIRPPEFTTLVRPFVGSAFATGIGTSFAGIGPLAILVLPDGSVLASGGANRGSLYHLPRQGGAAGAPIATLDEPIFAMALDAQRNLWATTGGGPLLKLDPLTGHVLA